MNRDGRLGVRIERCAGRDGLRTVIAPSIERDRRMPQELRKGLRPPGEVDLVEDPPEPHVRENTGSARGGAHGVEELSSGERLVEERGAGGAERFVRLFADGAGRDEDEPVADRGTAGRDLSQELEPVDAVQIESATTRSIPSR